MFPMSNILLCMITRQIDAVCLFSLRYDHLCREADQRHTNDELEEVKWILSEVKFLTLRA